MNHVLTVVILIALADSLNPSTIAPAVFLAGGRAPLRSVGAFILGVSVVNFAAGLLFVLGPGEALVAFVHRPGERTRHLLELGIGVGLLVTACVLWLARRGVARSVANSERRIDRSSFLIGSGIMAVEIPTAFPYFAALAVVVASGEPLAVQVGLTTLFDLIFAFPLLLVLVICLLPAASGRALLGRLRSGLAQRLSTVLPASVLVAGIVLIWLGAHRRS